MANEIPNWQFNVIPGNANQGAILMTRNDIQRPPFNQDDFIWLAMEDVIGTANIKLKYDKDNNIYILFKSKGHRNNAGEWAYQWEEVGRWEPLTAEVADILRKLVYVDYQYNTTSTSLQVIGIDKNGEQHELCNINFATEEYVQEAIAGLKRLVAGNCIELVDDDTSQTINLKFDLTSFDSNSNTLALKDIYKLQFKYMGEVNTLNDLPNITAKGDVYDVNDMGDMYVNISNNTTPNFTPFTKVANLYTYAIQLHKSSNGLYAELKYDNIDFTIDSLQQLKSQIIDDTIDGSSPLSNRKTYSVSKILNMLSSAMVYKGQVATYADLPTGLTLDNAGWTYNVVDTGDNYAWNGTGWDNLAGEYIAGTGIVINGKVISATGISFNVGDGLKVEGSGDNAVLSTRIANGLEYINQGTPETPINAIRVKGGNGIDVNASGVNVTAGDTIQIITDKVEVKPDKGLINTSTGLSINTNFTNIDTPLGSDTSNLNWHSDGKISVALGEALSGDYLFEQATFNVNQWYNLPTGKKFNDYTWIQVGRLNAAQFFNLPTTGSIFGIGVAMAGGSGGYLGMLCMDLEIDLTNNKVRLKQWGQYTTTNQVAYENSTTALSNINIIGIK